MNILRGGNVGTVALVLCGLLSATRTYGEAWGGPPFRDLAPSGGGAAVREPGPDDLSNVETETALEQLKADIAQLKQIVSQLEDRPKSIKGKGSDHTWLLVDLVLLVAAFLGGHAVWRKQSWASNRLSKLETRISSAVDSMEKVDVRLTSQLLGTGQEISNVKQQVSPAIEEMRAALSGLLRSQGLKDVIGQSLRAWEGRVEGAIVERVQRDLSRPGETGAGEGAFKSALQSTFHDIHEETEAALNGMRTSRSPVGQRHVVALTSALGVGASVFSRLAEGLAPEPDGRVVELEQRHRHRRPDSYGHSPIDLRDVVEAALDLRTLQDVLDDAHGTKRINAAILPTIAERFFDIWSEDNEALPSAAILDELNALLSLGDLELLIPEVGVRPSSVDVEVNEMVYDTGMTPRVVVTVLRPGLRYRGGNVLTRARVNVAG